MSVRKYSRHSDGNCEKGIGFLNENESRYSSKFHHNSVLHESIQQGKWSGTKTVITNNYNPSGSHKGDRTNHNTYDSKMFSKDIHTSDIYKGKGSSHSSPSRHNTSSVSVFNHQKSHPRTNADDFEWSQHISSSGKVYYYNRKSEKSQWEKPKEWIEREQQKAKEKVSAYKEGSREARESSRHSRSVPRRDGGREVSGYNKRDRDTHEHDKYSKVIKTEGASTSAATTITSRSSVGSTPDSGSPSCSSSGLQDISPPTTPTSTNMVSPYINTSTPGSVLSPHIYACSPGNLQATSALINHSSPSCISSGNSYALSHARPLYSSGGNELQTKSVLLNTNCSDSGTERISPTPPLHPLQQATLLQKQQLAGGVMHGVHKVAAEMASVAPNFLSQLIPCENSPPPPPPPHGAIRKQPLRQDSLEYCSRSQELRTGMVQARSSPLSHKHGLSNPDSPHNSKKYSRTIEPLVFPELKDIQVFSGFCSKSIYEDIAAWYGNVLDRQANSCWEEAMHSLTQEGGRTKANLILGNFVYDILDTRVEVIDRKLTCLKDVYSQVESLQDMRSGS